MQVRLMVSQIFPFKETRKHCTVSQYFFLSMKTLFFDSCFSDFYIIKIFQATSALGLFLHLSTQFLFGSFYIEELDFDA